MKVESSLMIFDRRRLVMIGLVIVEWGIPERVAFKGDDGYEYCQEYMTSWMNRNK